MFVYSSQSIKDIDLEAEKLGMPQFTLMELSGRGLFDEIKNYVTKADSILILAGKGNNGGDAVVLARYLQTNGYAANLVFPLGEPKTQTAKEHFTYFKALGCTCGEWALSKNQKWDWIVDGLLGVGSSLPLRDDLKAVVNWINQQESQVTSIDVPTGVSSDNGNSDEQTVRADLTMTLHGYKPSAFLEPASSYYGKTIPIDIGLKQSSCWKVWSEADVRETLPKRSPSSHKGTFGTGLLIAGGEEMPGSAALAAIGALRFGVGKLTVATNKLAASIIGLHAPEATFIYEEPSVIDFAEFSAIGIGPGCAPNEQLEKVVHKALSSAYPVVLDAGSLSKRDYPQREVPIVLTPHPGEFRKLTGFSTKDIQGNRIEMAKEYACKHRVILVLKGQNTVIAFPDGTGIISMTGNPSLAKGGSGDTLTGMLIASLSNHGDYKAAVANAVYLHGKCADLWIKENGVASLTAHDFSKLLPIILKPYNDSSGV